MILIDGSEGEGGGQVLRTALALSLVTSTPFKMKNIRARRKQPGLLRQHLTAVQAAVGISGSQVEGAEINSRELSFHPGAVEPGKYTFTVGSAGSTSLILQTVLLPLALTGKRSDLVLEGGTHNPSAPPFDYIASVFLPALERLGIRASAQLDRAGFYPAGGGRVRVSIEACATLTPLELVERGALVEHEVRSVIAGLAPTIGHRALHAADTTLGWGRDHLHLEERPENEGPGLTLAVRLKFEHSTAIFTTFGRRGIPAEALGAEAADAAKRFLDAPAAAVDEHLADQLLLPCALAGDARFTTTNASSHFETNLSVIRRFLPVHFEGRERNGAYEIRLATGL